MKIKYARGMILTSKGKDIGNSCFWVITSVDSRQGNVEGATLRCISNNYSGSWSGNIDDLESTFSLATNSEMRDYHQTLLDSFNKILRSIESSLISSSSEPIIDRISACAANSENSDEFISSVRSIINSEYAPYHDPVEIIADYSSQISHIISLLTARQFNDSPSGWHRNHNFRYDDAHLRKLQEEIKRHLWARDPEEIGIG